MNALRTPNLSSATPLRWPLLALASLLLAACVASVPIRDAPTLSPAPYLAGEQAQRFRGTDVLWGGTIVDYRSFEHYTELEIVAFPLDHRQRPLLDAPEQGRFIALRAGELPPSDFTPGRFITLRGEITGERESKLRGEPLPMAEVDARELILWSRDYRFDRPSFSVGVGIRVR
ncbi:Slp family lipoprotein [Pseudomarimonas arenosa]|uniref:Slp family lipoprotein n=1 Tax=Pseudomarimonas arenosa TaxID=2774145 RepID=A0AAW3ZEF2_9GAMM|nr:Slp family lipoprotein [Pseudomarimonas arenosa]MBD8524563.1 Slp family lipoprotein [Pseudomarimonas arenosa]